MDWLREVKETGQVRTMRHQVAIGDQEFWFSTSIVGIKDEQGQIFAFEIISRNITGRKSIEDRMINMEKLASIGTLAAGRGPRNQQPHDRDPGFHRAPAGTDGIPARNPRNPAGHRGRGPALQEDRGKSPHLCPHPGSAPKPGRMSTGILEKTLAVVKNTLLTKKIRLETSLAPNLPRVKGDPQELQQVFINLINNARDAMKGGGMLKVVTKPAPDGKRVAIEFSDTGNGIPREAQPKIFDPFFTTKKTGEGTGLGLSMSYGIITKFGGNIIFTSYPAEEYPEKHGTTFTVYLPMTRPGGRGGRTRGRLR